MARFKPAKVFREAVDQPAAEQTGRKPSSSTQITGLTFDDRGETLVTAGGDETFRLYNTRSGKFVKIFHSKKYGVDLPRFTHRNTTLLYASTKEDDTIRYHSLHDNKYLQYFRGHKKRVISLEVSPTDDGFISSSLDNTVRLWDLRTPSTRVSKLGFSAATTELLQGLLNLPYSGVVAYDTSGVVFAVALNHYSKILLYDTSNFDKEPFQTISIDDTALARISFPVRPLVMTSLEFSTNGKWLLVGTSGGTHYIMDAYDGYMLARLTGHQQLDPKQPLGAQPTRLISGEEVCWTPDSKYVLSGSEDGKIYVWDIASRGELTPPKPGRDADTFQPSVVLDGHVGPTRCLRFNPRYAMLATASNDLAFWLADNSSTDAEERDRDGDESTADETVGTTELKEEPIFKVSAAFGEDNPFSHIVNGQQNVIEISMENRTPDTVTVKTVSGTLTNPKTGAFLRNTTAQKFDFPVGAGSGIKLPYAFHNEAKPMEARFQVFVSYGQESVQDEKVAFDGLVTIVEPSVSLFDWRLLSTWGFVLALVGGAGYFTYINFFPAPKKATKTKKAAPVGPIDTPVVPGSGVYNEEWIPSHHIKKGKGRKDALSSGDESEGRRRRR
ncbi:member of Set1p complex, histone methyl transferase [Serendipita sp. 399]|nr:member of Set1p complex, histone methyl transferase [Serendipita sp. 399]